jgi:uncharacterized cupin superfamily protein
MPGVPELPARTIAIVEHHHKYWSEPAAAAEELRRVVGPSEHEIFLLAGEDGVWSAVAIEAPRGFVATRWVETRRLPAGEYEIDEHEGMRTERLVRRADGRPPFLIAAAEATTGEGEYEPGGETFGVSTRLGEAAGLRRIGVNVDVVRPGERSTKYHWHHDEEECFLVLAGTGLLQVADGSYRIGPGDFFAKKEGPERPHQFVNDGDKELRILTIGEHRGDRAEFPEPPWLPGAPLPRA